MPTANAKSRGYYKIKGAADAFNFDFRGKVVLDIGSSTGGFTQYALDHGAKKVIAIEKGTNQMMPSLRNDPRITLHEKTDIFDFAHEAFSQSESVFAVAEPATAERAPRKDGRASGLEDENKARALENDDCEPRTLRNNSLGFTVPDVILADVSFVSLKRVLLHTKKHLAENHTEFLVMLKPQFEAKPTDLINGVVKNEKIRREIIKNFEQWLKAHGFLILKKHDNELKGKTGNKERFYYLKLAK